MTVDVDRTVDAIMEATIRGRDFRVFLPGVEAVVDQRAQDQRIHSSIRHPDAEV